MMTQLFKIWLKHLLSNTIPWPVLLDILFFCIFRIFKRKKKPWLSTASMQEQFLPWKTFWIKGNKHMTTLELIQVTVYQNLHLCDEK